jgi:hypothetical protein
MTQSFPKDGAEALRLLLRHWRVLVVGAAAQIVGGVISFAFLRPYGAALLDLWIGAAVATLPGVVLGAAWHAAAPGRRAAMHGPLLLFLALMAIVLPAWGWLMFDAEAARPLGR